MTKEEYKNKICNSCIYKNCNSDICEVKKDDVIVYRCNNYVSIFECSKRSCKKCGKCNG